MNARLMLICTFALSFSDADKLECFFQNHVQFGYGCVVDDLSTKSITGVSGRHLPGKTNEDVSFVDASSSKLYFIPLEIKAQFPNIQTLILDFEKIEIITEDDLKQFGNQLTYLSISAPFLEFMPSNIFASTPNITNLFIEAPNLMIIETGALEKLQKLKNLTVIFLCMQANASDDVAVKILVSSLSECTEKKNPFEQKDKDLSQNVHFYDKSWSIYLIIICIIVVVAASIFVIKFVYQIIKRRKKVKTLLKKRIYNNHNDNQITSSPIELNYRFISLPQNGVRN